MLLQEQRSRSWPGQLMELCSVRPVASEIAAERYHGLDLQEMGLIK